MLCKICSDGLKKGVIKSTFSHILRFHQTHYEVLNLPKSCTDKEIKNAFITLSKEHHPDVNKSNQAHARFQQINEAYKILGKPESRRNYDLGLANPYYRSRTHKDPYYDHPMRDPYHDPLFWANRDKSRDKFYENKAYYGINGVARVSNGAIVVCCIVLTFVGVCVQYLAITKSFTFQRDQLIQKSLENEKTLNETRAKAANNGNNKQLEALKVRLLGNDK